MGGANAFHRRFDVRNERLNVPVGVFVFDAATSTVTARAVKTLAACSGFVPVLEGLKVGEKVISSGVGKLGNGMKVILAPPTANDENPDGVKAGVK
jgi:hypothetical protein